MLEKVISFIGIGIITIGMLYESTRIYYGLSDIDKRERIRKYVNLYIIITQLLITFFIYYYFFNILGLIQIDTFISYISIIFILLYLFIEYISDIKLNLIVNGDISKMDKIMLIISIILLTIIIFSPSQTISALTSFYFLWYIIFIITLSSIFYKIDTFDKIKFNLPYNLPNNIPNNKLIYHIPVSRFTGRISGLSTKKAERPDNGDLKLDLTKSITWKPIKVDIKRDRIKGLFKSNCDVNDMMLQFWGKIDTDLGNIEGEFTLIIKTKNYDRIIYNLKGDVEGQIEDESIDIRLIGDALPRIINIELPDGFKYYSSKPLPETEIASNLCWSEDILQKRIDEIILIGEWTTNNNNEKIKVKRNYINFENDLDIAPGKEFFAANCISSIINKMISENAFLIMLRFLILLLVVFPLLYFNPPLHMEIDPSIITENISIDDTLVKTVAISFYGANLTNIQPLPMLSQSWISIAPITPRLTDRQMYLFNVTLNASETKIKDAGKLKEFIEIKATKNTIFGSRSEVVGSIPVLIYVEKTSQTGSGTSNSVIEDINASSAQ